MRVVLLHNPSAGSEDRTDAQLVRLIERAGHQVVGVLNSPKRLTALLAAKPCDVVLIAGGDGTVSRTACELEGWGVPLAILPSGTANNTARSLGVPVRPKQVIKNLKTARPVPFDLVSFDDGSRRQRFSEALGWGLFSESVARAKERAFKGKRRATLDHNRKLFRAAVDEIEPRFYEVEVDGRSHSGDYLMVEVLNVPLLGPQLMVSPQSDPSDGTLEVLMVGEAERAALRELAGAQPVSGVQLPVQRGKVIRIRASDGLLHRDGGLIRHPPGNRDFEIRVHEKAVHYLR